MKSRQKILRKFFEVTIRDFKPLLAKKSDITICDIQVTAHGADWILGL